MFGAAKQVRRFWCLFNGSFKRVHRGWTKGSHAPWHWTMGVPNRTRQMIIDLGKLWRPQPSSTQMVVSVRESPHNARNSGLGIIVICSDWSCNHASRCVGLQTIRLSSVCVCMFVHVLICSVVVALLRIAFVEKESVVKGEYQPV